MEAEKSIKNRRRKKKYQRGERETEREREKNSRLQTIREKLGQRSRGESVTKKEANQQQ